MKGPSKNRFSNERQRNFHMQDGRDKIAAGIAKAISRTILRPTTQQVEIAADCSENGFLEVPFLCKTNPIFRNSGRKTMIIQKNEPNSNPIQSQIYMA